MTVELGSAARRPQRSTDKGPHHQNKDPGCAGAMAPKTRRAGKRLASGKESKERAAKMPALEKIMEKKAFEGWGRVPRRSRYRSVIVRGVSPDKSTDEDESPPPRDKKRVMKEVEAMKRKSDEKIPKETRSLNEDLQALGMPRGETCYEKALSLLCQECSEMDQKKQISERIALYIYKRLSSIRPIFDHLFWIEEWDKTVVSFLEQLLMGLNDLKVTIPQLQGIYFMASSMLRGEVPLHDMVLKDLVSDWMSKSMPSQSKSSMKKWAKNPTLSVNFDDLQPSSSEPSSPEPSSSEDYDLGSPYY